MTVDEHKNEEAEVSLSLPAEDWEHVLDVLKGRLVLLDYDYPKAVRLRPLVNSLDVQYRRQKAAFTHHQAFVRHKAAQPTLQEVLDKAHDAGGHVWDKPADPRKFLNEECR